MSKKSEKKLADDARSAKNSQKDEDLKSHLGSIYSDNVKRIPKKLNYNLDMENIQEETQEEIKYEKESF